MNVLMLYSWEQDREKRETERLWAEAFCNELRRLFDYNIYRTEIFAPLDRIDKYLSDRVREADKVLIIVNKTLNNNLPPNGTTISQDENALFSRVKESRDNRYSLFILKENGVGMPSGFRDYPSLRFSWLNYFDSKTVAKNDWTQRFAQIYRFFQGEQDYYHNKTEILELGSIPSSSVTFRKIFEREKASRDDKDLRDLVSYISERINKRTFTYTYLRSGLSSDVNLGGRLTPDLFLRYFMVSRKTEEDSNHVDYTHVINNLFNDDQHNLLCVESGGGSGKSCFIHTLYINDLDNSGENQYRNILFDLSSRTTSKKSDTRIRFETKVFEKFIAEYSQVESDSFSETSFAYERKRAFYKILSDIKRIDWSRIDQSLFEEIEFKQEYNDILAVLEKGEDIKGLYMWFSAYKNKLDTEGYPKAGKDLLLSIILLLLISLCLSKPADYNNFTRYIITFDNIETYDSGNAAERIAHVITDYYKLVEQVFQEVVLDEEFKTRITFVFVLRTSTWLPFGTVQYSIWGQGRRYVIPLHFYDFTIEAIIKKLEFLNVQIPNARNTVVFKEAKKVLQILIPDPVIERALSQDDSTNIDLTLREFASNQLLPLFNNNYRTVIEYIYSALTDPKHGDLISKSIEETAFERSAVYNSHISGTRMMIMRHIFDDLMQIAVLPKIGFPYLYGNNNHSMTRVVLEYLFWDEVKWNALSQKKSKDETYLGVPLSTLANTFKYFWDSKENFTTSLISLSIFSVSSNEGVSVSESWANLLVFEDEYKAMSEEMLRKAITNLAGDTPSNDSHVFVRLSDAGKCFVSYYMRSFEFLNARTRGKNVRNVDALFMLNDSGRIDRHLTNLYDIVVNCINKLLESCENSCVLYGGKNGQPCVMELQEPQVELLSCSLFVRYQECIDFIREGIDYVDRFRIVIASKHPGSLNDLILTHLQSFYNLYHFARKKLTSMSGCTPRIFEFAQMWSYPNNMKLNELIGHAIPPKCRIRLIQDYYSKTDESIDKAIVYLKENPLERLYDILQHQPIPEKDAAKGDEIIVVEEQSGERMNINNQLVEWAKHSPLYLSVLGKVDNRLTNALCGDDPERIYYSSELMSEIWSNHPKWGLMPNYELLSSFEHSGKYFKKYRDHLAHMFKVYLLGLYLFEKAPRVSRAFSDKKINMERFTAVWSITALFHDVGYVFNTLDSSIDSKTTQLVCDDLLKTMAHPLNKLYPEHITEAYETQLQNENRWYVPNRCVMTDLKAYLKAFNGIGHNVGLCMYNTGESNPIREYYNILSNPNEQFSHYDHGISSAIILLYMQDTLKSYITNAYKTINQETSEKGTPGRALINIRNKIKDIYSALSSLTDYVHEAAISLAVHNIKRKHSSVLVENLVAADVSIEYFNIPLQDEPFSYLLRLCDELQCWDRPYRSGPISAGLYLKGEKVTIAKKGENPTICIEDVNENNNIKDALIGIIDPPVEEWLGDVGAVKSL